MNNEMKEILRKYLHISKDIISIADEYSINSGEQYESCLIDLGIIEPLDLIRFKSAHYGMKAVNLEEVELSIETTKIIREGIARGYSLIAFHREEDLLFVAISNKDNLEVINHVLGNIKYEKSYYLELHDNIMRSLDKIYAFSDPTTISAQYGKLRTALIRCSRYELRRRRYADALSYIRKAVDCRPEIMPNNHKRSLIIEKIADDIKTLKDIDQSILNYPSEVRAYKEKIRILNDIKYLCSFLWEEQ